MLCLSAFLPYIRASFMKLLFACECRICWGAGIWDKRQEVGCSVCLSVWWTCFTRHSFCRGMFYKCCRSKLSGILQTSIKNCTFPREMRADSLVCVHFVRGAINCRDVQRSSATLISNGRDFGRKPAATWKGSALSMSALSVLTH